MTDMMKETLEVRWSNLSLLLFVSIIDLIRSTSTMFLLKKREFMSGFSDFMVVRIAIPRISGKVASFIANQILDTARIPRPPVRRTFIKPRIEMRLAERLFIKNQML